MGWDHLDLNSQLWLVPGEHAKNFKPHPVHLSASRSLLKAVPHTGELVFSVDGKRLFQGTRKRRLNSTSALACDAGRFTICAGQWFRHGGARRSASRCGQDPQPPDRNDFPRGRSLSAARVHKGTQEALELWGEHIHRLGRPLLMPTSAPRPLAPATGSFAHSNRPPQKSTGSNERAISRARRKASASMVLDASDSAVVVTGLDTVTAVRDGQPVSADGTITFVVAKRGPDWKIIHFHRSPLPK